MKKIKDYTKENWDYLIILDAVRWDELRECYKDSLETAIDYVLSRKDLFDDGKLVISSDHAECIGEPNLDKKGVYNHNYRHGIQPGSEGEKLLMTTMWWEL